MRILLILICILGELEMTAAQSVVKLHLHNDRTIKGEWLGMEDGQYLVGQAESTVVYIPRAMVYKMKVKPTLHAYPKFDQNRNGMIWGVTTEFNTTLGEKDHNFRGVGAKTSVGYDWNHRYAVMLSVGIRDMNLDQSEMFLPVSVTPIKYFTSGRFLMYGGMELGYNWGIKNQWASANSGLTWMSIGGSWAQPRHHNGHGASVTPLVGLRMIGKYGVDHVLSLGLHVQKFESERKFEDDYYSHIDLLYKRWQVSYGIVF